MTEEPAASQTTSASPLKGFWYPALLGSRVRGARLVASKLLGVPLAIGRDNSGRAFALEDICPHRSMPLSEGRFDGELVECAYHGWRFDPANGQCREIPSLTSESKLKVERICAGSFPCEERDGYVWVYLPDPDSPNRPVPEPPRLPVFSGRYRITHLSTDMACSIDHGIIGLMDPAHGPFVHQSWWWRSRDSIHEKEKLFEPIPNGFRISPHMPSTNSAPYKLLKLYGRPITSTIEFVLPNMRFEQVRCGPYWFSSRATVTPVTEERCRIDFCAAWNLLRWFPLVTPIFRIFAKEFLRQDQQTMEKQTVGLRYSPAMMLIDDADRPAKWYFQLKAAHSESVRSGKPMQHPIDGPVSLKWRS
jgi:phenylpropionate dioxygenase-like ring-hydroxylating dioxygenase large terminal subunit